MAVSGDTFTLVKSEESIKGKSTVANKLFKNCDKHPVLLALSKKTFNEMWKEDRKLK